MTSFIATLMLVNFVQGTSSPEENVVVLRGMELGKQLTARLAEDTGLRVRVENDDAPYPLDLFRANHTSFDVLCISAGLIGEAAQKGCFVDLARLNPPVVEAGSIPPVLLNYAGEFPPGSRTLYGVPWGFNIDIIAYRKDWFQDPVEKGSFKKKYGRELRTPETLDELAEIAEFFTRPVDKKAGLVLNRDTLDGNVRPFTSLLRAWGSSWGDPKTFRVKGHLDSAPSTQAFEFYLRLRKCEGDTVHFGDGRTAMFWHSYPCGDYVKTAAEENEGSPEGWLKRAQVGYFIVPKGKAGRGVSFNAVTVGVSQLIPKLRQERAIKFLRWFFRNDVQDQWTERHWSLLPVRAVSLKKSAEGDEAAKVVVSSLDHLEPFWNTPGRDILVSEFGGAVDEALPGRVPTVQTLRTLAETFEVVFRDHKLLK